MFNLTREEQQVILFLITVALVGMGIDFVAKRYSTVKRLISFDQNMCKIDLNKADKEALINITGIGEKLAERIIEYREKQTGFNQIEELKNIKGITDYKYEQIKAYLILK